MQEVPIDVVHPRGGARREQEKTSQSFIVGLTSFSFILLQSACTAVMAISGLRFLIGIGSLASASGIKFLVAFHADAIRIPMMIVAVVGSVINLYVIWRIRTLRSRSSSQWRIAPVAPAKKRSEVLQIALAVVTLLLVVVELTFHIHLHGSV